MKKGRDQWAVPVTVQNRNASCVPRGIGTPAVARVRMLTLRYAHIGIETTTLRKRQLQAGCSSVSAAVSATVLQFTTHPEQDGLQRHRQNYIQKTADAVRRLSTGVHAILLDRDMSDGANTTVEKLQQRCFLLRIT